jgi:hypothetical protein
VEWERVTFLETEMTWCIFCLRGLDEAKGVGGWGVGGGGGVVLHHLGPI